ncbi:MAG: hypothetical protein M3320_07065 [Actinomycetota bacterium]|nr:hypothetical protein [Actinomycetota bacterium]
MPSRTPPEALDALRERLRATQEAAQRLADEATSSIGSSGVPPAGWDVPGRAEDANAELEALVALLGTLRDVLPPELRAQLAELVKAALVFIRTVLDFAIGEIERGGSRGDDPPVEDIPIS